MNLQEQIAAFAAEAEAHTGRSKLEPYEALIRTLRQKRWTYAEISAALRDRYGVAAAPGTVHSFVKVRSMRRSVMTMLPDEPPAPGVVAPPARLRQLREPDTASIWTLDPPKNGDDSRNEASFLLTEGALPLAKFARFGDAQIDAQIKHRAGKTVPVASAPLSLPGPTCQAAKNTARARGPGRGRHYASLSLAALLPSRDPASAGENATWLP